MISYLVSFSAIWPDRPVWPFKPWKSIKTALGFAEGSQKYTAWLEPS